MNWLLRIAVLAGILALVALALPAFADTLTTRVCPDQAAIDAGTDPNCVMEHLILPDLPGLCAALSSDLSSQAAWDALVASFPAAAQKYAAYSTWPGEYWCTTSATSFTVPAIP